MKFRFDINTKKALLQALFQGFGMYIATSMAGLPTNIIWASTLFGFLGGSIQDILGFRMQLKEVPPTKKP